MLPYQTFPKIMRIAQRIFLIFCAISMISGIALAADHDVIIGFHQPPGLSEKALIHDHGGVVKNSFHLIPAIAAKLPENNIEKLKKNPRVAYIEDDKIFKAAADEYTSSWGVQHIGSNVVHAQGINGTGVKIAILDTGIDYNHPDLDGNYKFGYDFVFGDTDPFDDSYNSHGTHVAGIIVAENNGIGVVGVAPNAEIYALKVLEGGGFGFSSWIISGMQWAVDNNMDIVSMSIEGPEDAALHEAVDKAYNAGLLLVAAGGNYRTGTGPVKYPAAYDSVIAVTATDAADHNASFASIGPEIELGAPGVGISSTIKGGYGFMDGTSMAAPHMTGVAALIISKGIPDVNGDGVNNNTDVRLKLQMTARDLGVSGWDNIYGYGLVDAQMAVLGVSDIELTLIRTNGPADKDAQKVPISPGYYEITIHNSDLTKLDMEVRENGVIRKDLSSKFKFNHSDNVNLQLNVDSTVSVEFIPYGSQGSTGHVTIRRVL
jgi:subtilisin